MEYKNERLTKINEDLRKEAVRVQIYDKFLKKKMEDLHSEMEKIGVAIKGFEENSLKDANKNIFHDTFSDVTESLMTIQNDLCQERVDIFKDASVPQSEKKGESGAARIARLAKHRVQQVEVLPFE